MDVEGHLHAHWHFRIVAAEPVWTRNGLRVGKCLNNREWTAARVKADIRNPLRYLLITE